jgi:hypothetical protein
MSITPQNLETTNEFLTDLISRRGIKKAGNQSTRVVELNGGQVIEPTAFPPDPNSHRSQYYYNANTNALYRKITTFGYSHWQKISN